MQTDAILLSANGDGETALYEDRRCGFAQALPGHPRLGTGEPAADEPRYDALVVLADLPVRLRYRLSDLPSALDPRALALQLASSYARGRSDEEVAARPAVPEQLVTWGVDAAASALYPLRAPDATGADGEEVLVLLRRGQVMTISKRFRREETDWIAWALWNSAATGTLRWGLPPEASAWPASRFLLPGVRGALRPERERQMAQLARLLDTTQEERGALAERLTTLISAGDAPAQPVTPEMRQVYAQYLLDVCASPSLEEALVSALDEVDNAQDLRGLAILFGRVLELQGLP